jgi:malonate-semialdehyde dehydrogenase (acetylating)/methylmalonate-semialdehyde dehydrogenase
MERLELFINNEYVPSKTTEYYKIYNPSTGEIIAEAPKCTSDEAELAIKSAAEAFES